MKKDIPLTIESITDTDEQECRITSAKQIESILRNIAESGTNAALYFNPHRDFIMTTILDIDEDGMWVEQGGEAATNRHIAESKRLKLVSSHNQVKVQFAVGNASPVTYDDRPAFFLPMPDAIYRFQRREYFRLSLPHAERLRCVLNITKPKYPDAPPQREVSVMDISGGGLGLVCTEDELDLVPGESFSNCELDLPEIGPVRVNLVVRNLVPLLKTITGKTINRAGCEFNKLDGPTTVKLQRYITDKQRLIAASAL